MMCAFRGLEMAFEDLVLDLFERLMNLVTRLDTEASVTRQSSACRDESTHDHVLLQATQMVDLSTQ